MIIGKTPQLLFSGCGVLFWQEAFLPPKKREERSVERKEWPIERISEAPKASIAPRATETTVATVTKLPWIIPSEMLVTLIIHNLPPDQLKYLPSLHYMNGAFHGHGTVADI